MNIEASPLRHVPGPVWPAAAPRMQRDMPATGARSDGGPAPARPSGSLWLAAAVLSVALHGSLVAFALQHTPAELEAAAPDFGSANGTVQSIEAVAGVVAMTEVRPVEPAEMIAAAPEVGPGLPRQVEVALALPEAPLAMPWPSDAPVEEAVPAAAAEPPVTALVAPSDVPAVASREVVVEAPEVARAEAPERLAATEAALAEWLPPAEPGSASERLPEVVPLPVASAPEPIGEIAETVPEVPEPVHLPETAAAAPARAMRPVVPEASPAGEGPALVRLEAAPPAQAPAELPPAAVWPALSVEVAVAEIAAAGPAVAPAAVPGLGVSAGSRLAGLAPPAAAVPSLPDEITPQPPAIVAPPSTAAALRSAVPDAVAEAVPGWPAELVPAEPAAIDPPGAPALIASVATAAEPIVEPPAAAEPPLVSTPAAMSPVEPPVAVAHAALADPVTAPAPEPVAYEAVMEAAALLHVPDSVAVAHPPPGGVEPEELLAAAPEAVALAVEPRLELEVAGAEDMPPVPLPNPIPLEQREAADRSRPPPPQAARPRTERLAQRPGREAAAPRPRQPAAREPAAVRVAGAQSPSDYERLVRSRIVRVVRSPARAPFGTVVVRFTVNADGSVSGRAIAESSGVAALDRAALAAVRGPFPPIPSAIGRRSMSFAVPIRFADR